MFTVKRKLAVLTVITYCVACDIFAHTHGSTINKIETIEGLCGKLCYEIYNSKVCSGLWGTGDKSRTVSIGHPVYVQLLSMYGLGHTVCSKITY